MSFGHVQINGELFPCALLSETDTSVKAVVFGWNGSGAVVVDGIPKASTLEDTNSVLHYQYLEAPTPVVTPVDSTPVTPSDVPATPLA